MIIIAETISFGIISLRLVLVNFGMVAGIVLIAAPGIAATHTGCTIYQFNMAYPRVHNVADACDIMLGPIGGEVFGAAQVIFLAFTMGGRTLPSPL